MSGVDLLLRQSSTRIPPPLDTPVSFLRSEIFPNSPLLRRPFSSCFLVGPLGRRSVDRSLTVWVGLDGIKCHILQGDRVRRTFILGSEDFLVWVPVDWGNIPQPLFTGWDG